MAYKVLTLLSILAVASDASGSRSLKQAERQLLDATEQPFTNSTILWFLQPAAENPSQTSCGYLKLFPGGSVDGPNRITVGAYNAEVTVGTKLQLVIKADNSSGIFRGTSTGDVDHFTGYSAAVITDTISLTYSPVEVGQGVNYSASAVPLPTNPLGDCNIVINFTSVAPPPPPPPPTGADACTSGPPCYCQPDGSYCFNNGATLTTSCTRPSNYACVGADINPATLGAGYANYANPVNVCKCSAKQAASG